VLIELKVTNFRSIREQQTFSLVASNADKELPNCILERNLPGLAGVKFLKGAAIYGANASGKSNLIDAVDFIGNYVRRSAVSIQPGEATGAQPFKLDSSSLDKPSSFEITFFTENTRFVFGFSITPKRVVEEYLYAYPNGLPQKWYHRAYDVESGEYKWEKPSAAFRQDKSLQDKTRDNSLFLSVGPQFNHAQLTMAYKWIATHLRVLNNARQTISPIYTMGMVPDPVWGKRVLNLLRSADIGVSDARIVEKQEPADDIKAQFIEVDPADGKPRKDKEPQPLKVTRGTTHVSLYHRGEANAAVALDFGKEESLGTQRFFSLIGPWLETMHNGYTVFIDEIETSLHPLLVRELLKLLFSDGNNPGGAQVVFTTHNPILLDNTLMRRDQIWFTEKTPAGATHLYPLTDYSPRKDEALAKGYLAGRYGAIPFIPEGLQL